MNSGLYAFGEFLEFSSRTSGEKTFYNVSVLIGTTIKRFNVPNELVAAVAPTELRSKVKIKFNEFVGRNFTTTNLESLECLK